MRNLNSFWKKTVTVLSIGLVAFQLYTTAFGVFSDLIQRSIHMGFVLSLCFILKPLKKSMTDNPNGKIPFYDVFFSLIAIASTVFICIYSSEITWDPLKWYGPLDVVFAVALTIMIIEAARRTVGWTFPIMICLFLLYAYYGEIFPGIWGHKRFGVSLILQTFYHTTNGIWGTMVGISATILAMFSVFAAVLGETGGSETFVKIGKKLTGRLIGGTAKMSLISDALFGMISGSAMANVVGTGVFTIPMMKKSGFPPKWAAAFEAVGSTGGQLMPPIMGSAAFIMAQIISKPYKEIAVSAIIPAVLYYVGVYVAINGIAKQHGILGTNDKVIITASEYSNIFGPLGVFIIFLIQGFSAANAAFFASIAAVIVCTTTHFLSSKSLVNSIKYSGTMTFNSALKGASNIIDMAGLLGGAQLVITLISMTGFGVKLSDLIVSAGKNNLFLCLVLSMLVCILLGMGLPTTAAYVLGAAVLVPALTTLGIDTFVAHMFVFFFSCLATITPPVCAAVFLASGIAESNWFQTGIAAVLAALPAFIVPYTFAYTPALLMIGTGSEIILAFVAAIIGVIMLEMGVSGYIFRKLNIISRILLALSGIMMVWPERVSDIIGLCVGGSILLIEFFAARKHVRVS